MDGLVDFMIRSVATQPDQVSINTVEGDASVLFEVSLSDDDRARLLADDKSLLQSVQAVLSASSGRRRAVLELAGDAAPSDQE